MGTDISLADKQTADRELSDICRALSSPVRLRMLRILAEKERVCGDIVEQFHLSQSTVSHHLRTLRDSGLVEVEERGTSTCYRLNHERLAALKRLIAQLTSIRSVSLDGERHL